MPLRIYRYEVTPTRGSADTGVEPDRIPLTVSLPPLNGTLDEVARLLFPFLHEHDWRTTSE
jgi:hypothetical protein